MCFNLMHGTGAYLDTDVLVEMTSRIARLFADSQWPDRDLTRLNSPCILGVAVFVLSPPFR